MKPSNGRISEFREEKKPLVVGSGSRKLALTGVAQNDVNDSTKTTKLNKSRFVGLVRNREGIGGCMVRTLLKKGIVKRI